MGFATEDIKNSATLSEGEKAELKRIEDEKIAAEVRRQLMEIEQQNKIPIDDSKELITEIENDIVKQDEINSGIDSLSFDDNLKKAVKDKMKKEVNEQLDVAIDKHLSESFSDGISGLIGMPVPDNVRTWGPGISGFDGEKINYGNREQVISLGDKGVEAEIGRKPIISEETGELEDGFQLSNAGSTLHMKQPEEINNEIIKRWQDSPLIDKFKDSAYNLPGPHIQLDDIHTHKNETIQVTNQQPQKKWFGMNTFTDKRERFGFFMFMLPITLMSIVSMIHLVDFFKIGTSPTTAWMLGAAFELASLSTIVALVLLRKISRIALISVFFLLYALQMVGNIYSPFATINPQEASRLFDFFGFTTIDVNAQRWVAVIQGSILPTVNLLLFKLTSNYLRSEK